MSGLLTRRLWTAGTSTPPSCATKSYKSYKLTMASLMSLWGLCYTGNFFLIFDLFLLFHVYECFAYMYICVPHSCLVPEEIVRLHVCAGVEP